MLFVPLLPFVAILNLLVIQVDRRVYQQVTSENIDIDRGESLYLMRSLS